MVRHGHTEAFASASAVTPVRRAAQVLGERKKPFGFSAFRQILTYR